MRRTFFIFSVLAMIAMTMSFVSCDKDKATSPREPISNDTILSLKNAPTIIATYNTTKAKQYADNYWPADNDNNNHKFYFGIYTSNNCTNFINQCIMAGLCGSSDVQTVWNARNTYQDEGTPGRKWYFDAINTGMRSPTWVGANELRDYADENLASYSGMHFNFITRDYSGNGAALNVSAINVGDIIFVDYTDDGTMDHSLIVVEKTGGYYDNVYVASHTDYYGHKKLSIINTYYNNQATFHVYRPTHFSEW